uniref:Uncharacterized protein n=1 Tax=Triticum urartu TaxID=4572 RepID=A0A8R7V1Y7_TRIUA
MCGCSSHPTAPLKPRSHAFCVHSPQDLLLNRLGVEDSASRAATSRVSSSCDESAGVQQVVMMQSCSTLHRWKLTEVASPQHASTRGLSGGEEPLRFKGAELHGHPTDGGGEQQARVVELQDLPSPRACSRRTP